MATPRPPQLDTTSKFASPAATIRSLSQLLEDDRRTPLATAFSSRPASRSTAAPPRGAGELQLQGMLAAKESEAALLRQQLQQLTADFKFNLKLLEERDAELERIDTVIAGLKEAATMRDAALQEARRALCERDAALREKEARVSALEERQKQLVELCERQVADARCSRDEEVARLQQDMAVMQSEAAKAKAEVIAGYERQVSAAAASEREARQRSQQLAEENEHVRSQLQRAEARVAEQELAMQRMVVQFEGALATLQQLEAQYDALAADAGAADQLRLARIADLERENEALRVARAGAAQERDASVAALSAQLAEEERAAAEAKQQYHRAMMDAAELTEALSGIRQEAAALRGRAQELEAELAAVRSAAQQSQSALEREVSAHARTQGLLETARLHQETARRDAREQEALAAQLREAAAVLEAERNDRAKAAVAAEAKLQATEERMQLLADQLEQERQLHSEMLESREAEVAARWERALEAAQGERATLQQALDLANRQLQAAHRDVETLRLQVQVQHVRLGAPGHDVLGPARAAAGGGSMGLEEYEHPFLEADSPAGSRDELAGLPDRYTAPSGALRQQLGDAGDGVGSGPAARSYQQQLHRHIDTLAGKLSNFQRAVEEARHMGQKAAQQLAESSRMLPTDLQQRQAAVADQQLQHALAVERQQFEQERQRLDQQLAEQKQMLEEREAELQRMQRAEQERQQQERRRQQQQVQQQQQQRMQQEAMDGSAALPLPVLGAASPASSGLGKPPGGVQQQVPATQPARPAASYGQRRSVSAALAAISSGPGPQASVTSGGGGSVLGTASSQYASSPEAAQLPLPRLNGGAMPAAGRAGASQRAAPLRASGSSLGAASHVALLAAVAGPAGASDEDPLARARRQVLAAKSYLRQVAEMGGRAAAGGNSTG